jgi:hypothetical protein
VRRRPCRRRQARRYPAAHLHRRRHGQPSRSQVVHRHQQHHRWGLQAECCHRRRRRSRAATAPHNNNVWGTSRRDAAGRVSLTRKAATEAHDGSMVCSDDVAAPSLDASARSNPLRSAWRTSCARTAHGGTALWLHTSQLPRVVGDPLSRPRWVASQGQRKPRVGSTTMSTSQRTVEVCSAQRDRPQRSTPMSKVRDTHTNGRTHTTWSGAADSDHAGTGDRGVQADKEKHAPPSLPSLRTRSIPLEQTSIQRCRQKPLPGRSQRAPKTARSPSASTPSNLTRSVQNCHAWC